MERFAEIKRKTNETDVNVSINLDNIEESKINTGIGFLDHMLNLFAKHGFMKLYVTANGDTYIDAHHTIEDIGIVLGLAIKETLKEKEGITRYGTAYVPMDEALSFVSIDISGRPYLVFNANFQNEKIGQMETQMVEEFFRALAFNAEITLHINLLYGKNDHHIAESIFKAFGKALSIAISKNDKINGVLSSKGMI